MCIVGWELTRQPPKETTLLTSQPRFTQAITLPHHDLLLDYFPDFYGFFTPEDRQRVDRIILVSPNHFSPESLAVVGRLDDFVLENQVITVDRESMTRLIDRERVTLHNERFQDEHGVLLHLPFIAEYFPNAQLIPLLLTRNIPRKNFEALLDELRPVFADERTIIIASIDFSHNLSASQAWEKDSTLLALVRERSVEEIFSLGDEYLDCPACLAMILGLVGDGGSEPELLFHDNSAHFLLAGEGGATTSYLVLRWFEE